MLVESSSLKGKRVKFCVSGCRERKTIYFSTFCFGLCRMTLLLGPPTSGKTTLLLALAGRLSKDLKVRTHNCWVWRIRITSCLWFIACLDQFLCHLNQFWNTEATHIIDFGFRIIRMRVSKHALTQFCCWSIAVFRASFVQWSWDGRICTSEDISLHKPNWSAHRRNDSQRNIGLFSKVSRDWNPLWLVNPLKPHAQPLCLDFEGSYH